MEDQYIKGTPSAVLLPAKNYVFKISKDNYVIRIPKSGKYHDIDPEFFDVDSGEFDVYNEETKTLYLPSITKVLFATSKYPDLKFNQFFAPYIIKFEGDEVVVVGQVIDMMLVKDDQSEE